MPCVESRALCCVARFLRNLRDRAAPFAASERAGLLGLQQRDFVVWKRASRVLEADQRFNVYAACIDAYRYSWPLAMGGGDDMGIEIIRQGDKTTHGGVVLEGSPTHFYMGKPVALVGHNVFCPKCKGIFAIVEGTPTVFFGGKNVALAGMRTACGAVLVATQFTGTIESGGAATGSAPADRSATSAGTALPDVVETWKWRGVPVWEHGGIVCTGETYKEVVKLTFHKGASLDDPARLFNASLDGNARRAIDLRQGQSIDDEAFKALVRTAADLNAGGRTKGSSVPAQQRVSAS
jgi:uncharacterized Zn-binding protein involved in type VI secretion